MQRVGIIQPAVSTTGTYCQALCPAAAYVGAGKFFTLGGIYVSTSIIVTFLSGATGSVQPQLVDPQGTVVGYGSAITASTFTAINSPIFGVQLNVTVLSGGNLYLAIYSTML